MSDLPSLKKQRSTAKAKLTNIVKFIDTINEDTDIEVIRIRLSRVDSLMIEFTSIESKIFDVDHAEEPDFDFEEKYYVAKAKLNAVIRQRTMVSSNEVQGVEMTLNASHCGQAEVKLPKISIPHFSGEYTEWQSFYDLFSTTIHESPLLSPAQKLQYLKGSLKGEAAALLRHISVTEANYLEALHKLKDRYDRKKHIINSFIRAFVEHPPLNTATAGKMKNLRDSADEVVRGLKALGPTAESRDPWLIYWLVTKLDDKSKCMWAETSAESENPNLDEFFRFLQIRIDALESLSSSLKSGSSKASVKSHVVAHETTKYACVFCEHKDHSLFDCSQFNNLDVSQRREWIQKSRRCFNCFSSRHVQFRCQSKRRCQLCTGKHHTLLHLKLSETGNLAEENVSSLKPKTTSSATSSSMISNCAEVLKLQSVLPTALITVLDLHGKPQMCRALLDSGSQASFITESCVCRLNLKRSNSRISVSGLGLTKAGFTRGRVSLEVQPHSYPNFTISALVLSKLTSELPSQTITGVSTDIWSTLQLADPHFNRPGVVDILIGADHFFSVLRDGRKQFNRDGPILQNTIFGWVVSGCYKEEVESKSFLITNCMDQEANIDVTLKRFWEIESIGERKNMLSTEEELCEKHFKENFTRNSNGKFVVGLPFKQPADELSNTLNVAIQRQRSMERRFARDDEFKTLYHSFMAEYEQLRHMEKIPDNEIATEGYYLPHHGVLRNASSTTKLRVVFDGSAKTNIGNSLNNYLAVGPTIQSNLYSILLRFREHRFAISADIEKMYRQVLINPSDTKFQKIVWRKQPTDPICFYRLLTVTYGLSSAPFLAIRCLQQIVEEHKHSSPLACHEIKKNIYVDDLMTAVDTVQQGIQLKEDISNLLLQYGFQLRKWSSNCQPILESISNKADIAGNIKELDDVAAEPLAYIKVLGVSWDPQNDNFLFKASVQAHTTITKRVILSEASRLFDPLGWLAPVVIAVKIFMQQLWILSLKWDDPLPEEQKQKWQRLRSNLQDVEHITIPRFLGSSAESIVDIHGFCDASENAYAAVIYFKFTTSKGVFVHLISSKTKVAPIKQVSLPRLELCGAVLLSKLIETVKYDTSLKINNIFAWTDSKIVLDWLASEPRRWTTFIANRTSAIIDVIPRHYWRHVPSLQNPADCASRGISGSDLKEHKLWWNGPDWLNYSAECWPLQKTEYGCKEEEQLIKVDTFGGFINNDLFERLLANYSSFFKLQRIVAFILRFINNTKIKLPAKRSKGHFLKPQELFIAFQRICEYEQRKSYYEEISTLKRNGNVSKSSRIISLNPFIDRGNLLRVGGRLENSAAPYSTKHPVILPPKSNLTKIILEDLHQNYSHAGPSLLLSIFRQTYWTTNGRTIVREVTRNCIVCRRYKATLQQQMMGDLPTCRVELVRPFYKTGVDFAGPLSIHLTKGRGQKTYKAYISLFVCMSTKAVHLELVGDLTSESFVAALKRFIARRGVPSEIHSDNGTNFVGANKRIGQEVENIIKNSANISHYLSRNTISWHFIPPGAPHFGGIWEAAVKSTKFHLKRVIGKTILTMEEMNTLLAEVESCLNSRPICVLSTDEIDALTPAYFLVGHPLTKLPELDVTKFKGSYVTRWKIVQQLHQHFWKRWHNEYLTSLQQRTKWKQPKSQIQMNDVVVIKDNLSLHQWLLGKVIQLHPGNDGVVRVVTLKTKSGDLKRPIHKLCLLPVYNNIDKLSTTEGDHISTETEKEL